MTIMKQYKVYKITNKVNGHNYVGYTKLSLEERFKLHKNSKTTKMPIVMAIKKYGSENFEISLLSKFETKEEAVLFEILMIEELRPDYNIHSGGTGGPMYGSMNGMFGKKHSDEWKNNKSKSMLGDNNPMYNKTHSDIVKKLLSEIKIGHTPWNKGKIGVYSNEVIEKLKKPKTEEHKNKLKKEYKFISPEGRCFIVFGLTEFCKENGLNKGAMSEVYSGKRKSYKGWIK